MGVRTSREIEEERFALKYLRGDFEPESAPAGRPDAVLGTTAAVRAQ